MGFIYDAFQSLPRPVQLVAGIIISLGTCLIFGIANAIATVWIIFVRIMEFRKVEVAEIDRKHVVVTGCDSGFGRSIALRLARRGMTVHAGCYTVAGLAELKEDSIHEKLRSKLNVYPLDISKQASVDAFKADVQKSIPKAGLWAIVNNAGVLCPYIEDSQRTLDSFRSNMEVNFFGTVRMIHSFVPLMNRTQGGRVVVMCSSASHQPTELVLPYVSSKSAIFGYANSLRLELVSANIKVITVSPGFYKTALYDNMTVELLQSTLAGLPNDKRPSAEEMERLVAKRQRAMENYSDLMASCNTDNDVPGVLEGAVCLRYPKLHHRVGYEALQHNLLPCFWTEAQTYLIHYGRLLLFQDVDLYEVAK